MATKRLLFSCMVLMALAGAGTALWGQTGGFAYVANFASNDVSAYTIDTTTGALTPIAGSPFAAGAGAHWTTTDLTGQFLYVANRGADNVSAFTIDGTTGALAPIGTFPAGRDA